MLDPLLSPIERILAKYLDPEVLTQGWAYRMTEDLENYASQQWQDGHDCDCAHA